MKYDFIGIAWGNIKGDGFKVSLVGVKTVIRGQVYDRVLLTRFITVCAICGLKSISLNNDSRLVSADNL